MCIYMAATFGPKRQRTSRHAGMCNVICVSRSFQCQGASAAFKSWSKVTPRALVVTRSTTASVNTASAAVNQMEIAHAALVKETSSNPSASCTASLSRHFPPNSLKHHLPTQLPLLVKPSLPSARASFALSSSCGFSLRRTGGRLRWPRPRETSSRPGDVLPSGFRVLM